MAQRKLKGVGTITHYFTKISVAIVELTGTLSVADKIFIQGPTTSFEQSVASMQIEHKNITTAQVGQSIGLKVEQRVRELDKVYKVIQ